MKMKGYMKKVLCFVGMMMLCCVLTLVIAPCKVHAAKALSLSSSGGNFGGGKCSGSFGIYCDSSTNWTAYVPGDTWIRIDKSSGYGNATIKFDLLTNVSGKTRTGTIVVRTCEADATVREYKVTQTSTDVYISVSQTLVEFQGQQFMKFFIDVKSNVSDWTVSADKEWIIAQKYGSSDSARIVIRNDLSYRRNRFRETGYVYVNYNGKTYAKIKVKYYLNDII